MFTCTFIVYRIHSTICSGKKEQKSTLKLCISDRSAVMWGLDWGGDQCWPSGLRGRWEAECVMLVSLFLLEEDGPEHWTCQEYGNDWREQNGVQCPVVEMTLREATLVLVLVGMWTPLKITSHGFNAIKPLVADADADSSAPLSARLIGPLGLPEGTYDWQYDGGMLPQAAAYTSTASDARTAAGFVLQRITTGYRWAVCSHCPLAVGLSGHWWSTTLCADPDS